MSWIIRFKDCDRSSISDPFAEATSDIFKIEFNSGALKRVDKRFYAIIDVAVLKMRIDCQIEPLNNKRRFLAHTNSVVESRVKSTVYFPVLRVINRRRNAWNNDLHFIS